MIPEEFITKRFDGLPLMPWPTAMVISLETEGRKHWAELHSQRNPTREWFDDWLSRIPMFGCDCETEFAKILELHPVRFEDFFEWSVEAHNAVNRKLGKQEMSLEEAYRIWR